MNKNDIITEIYNSNLFEKMASTYEAKLGGDREDWIQHMYLFTCEIPEEKLLDLYEKKELNYYLFYVGKAQAFNDNSEFWREHKGKLNIEYSIDDPNYKQISENRNEYGED